MSELNEEQEPDFIIDETNTSPSQQEDPLAYIKEIATDRKGKQLSVDEMRSIQNNLMKRPKDFESWAQNKKNDYLLKELEKHYLGQLPPLEEVQALNKKLVQEVAVDDETDIHSIKAPRINLKAEKVALTLTSDGKTIQFNNQEALAQYRESIKQKNQETQIGNTGKKIDPKKQVDQSFGESLRKNRSDWE